MTLPINGRRQTMPQLVRAQPMLRFCAIAAVLIGFLSVDLMRAEEAKRAPAGTTRILFIGKNPDHPYGSHMYMHVSGLLARCVELTPGVEGVVSNGWPSDPKM